jgi:hypothetical protein
MMMKLMTEVRHTSRQSQLLTQQDLVGQVLLLATQI